MVGLPRAEAVGGENAALNLHVEVLTAAQQAVLREIDDISRVLYSLCYFEDADPDPMPRMHTSVTWEEAKADIRAWVKATAASER
jgi:hypothetical protein